MRLIVVCNRLPFTLETNGGEIELKPSMGGVATGLYSCFLSGAERRDDSEIVWYGSSTVALENINNEKVNSLPFKFATVLLNQELHNGFYNEFCNQALYPLLTNFSGYFRFSETAWECYRRVNEMFAEKIAESLMPGDVVWINDYHFLLLPGYLRKINSLISINFFLHVPFSAGDIFDFFPEQVARQLIEGVLSANLVGFHIQEYLDNFLIAARRTSPVSFKDGFVWHAKGRTRVSCCPMSVDFERYQQAAVEQAKSTQLDAKKKSKILLSVDRLDYTKGILNKLWAFEFFLERYPEWRGKVSFTVIVAPSRLEVPENIFQKKQIEKLVDHLNYRYANDEWRPVEYYFRKFEFRELVDRYYHADVAIVTPLKDGMNLVAKEFIACKVDDTGSLILSREAGARYELPDAHIVDPLNITELANAVECALSSEKHTQQQRIRKMREIVKKNDIVHWMADLLKNEPNLAKSWRRTDKLDSERVSAICRDFFSANKRILFLDYDGTLADLHENPDLAVIEPELFEAIRTITEYRNTRVIIVSGRKAGFIENKFGNLEIDYAAEYGSVLRKNKSRIVHQEVSNNWKPVAKSAMERVSADFAHTMIEEKDYSLVVHFKRNGINNIDEYMRSMLLEFNDIASIFFLEIVKAKSSLEIKSVAVNKGKALANWLAENAYEFILAAGDDESDEEMFKALPDHAHSLRIGQDYSRARYSTHSNTGLTQLLKKLADEITSEMTWALGR